MSDEGEPGAHWSASADYTSDNEPAERATTPATEGPPSHDRFAGEASGSESTGPESSASSSAASAESAASVPVFERRPWERSLFDGESGGEAGAGDPRYAGYTPSGPSSPPKPGTPSSGNLRLPEWMREEMQGGDEDRPLMHPADKYEEDEHRSRLMLYFGVGLLLVALLAAAAVFVLKSSGGKDDAGESASQSAGAGAQPAPPDLQVPADKPLMVFRGTHTKAAGLLPDRFSGLMYPRLGAPWQIPSRKSGLGRYGWSGQQVIVTEKRGGRPSWFGQLLSGTLSAAQRNLYSGPGTERAAAAALAQQFDSRFYAFPHRTRNLASQRLTVDGHKGWLVGSYIGYRQRGVKATGDVVAVAVVDTGRSSPGVMFMAIPNTNRNLWPDVNYVLRSLKVAS
jgi:hypothetical protein